MNMTAKNIALFICTVFIARYAGAQVGRPVELTTSQTITVGKATGTIGKVLAELYYTNNGRDTLYTLRYKNEAFPKLEKYNYVRFSGTGNARQALYELFKSVFTDEHRKNKDYVIQFPIGNQPARIATYRQLGTTYAMFAVNDGFFYINERQVDHLFGK